ncbi:MAG: nucleoside-diphosphate-sugar pyrophosphorylase [Desulfobacteraceae bacterium]|nr:MAG: nucleoside-diphosphate-sugar pyrophosphorylase [Desulfobacteraceae bacterium]
MIIMNDPVGSMSVIILAAGLGTRMKSKRAKVLHPLMGRAMILYVVETARQIAGENIIVVVGHQAESVRSIVSECATVTYAYQREQRGTGHAVQTAMPHIKQSVADVVILCGDVPLLTARTIHDLIVDHRRNSRDITLLAVELENPTGYGRVVLDENGSLLKIVEEADATDAQRAIKTINSGIYCVSREALADTVQKLNPNNAQGEFYLTDIIEIGKENGKSIGVLFGKDAEEVSGVNTLSDLNSAEQILSMRRAEMS